MILLSIGLKAQIPKSITKQDSISLSERFKDKKVIVYENNTIYTFKYDKNSHKIIAYEERKEYFVRLSEEKNSKISLYDYYSDNSSIELIRGKGWFFRNLGKVNLDGVFHHDFYSAEYYSYVPELNKIYPVTIKKTYNDSRYLTSIYFQMDLPIHHQKLIFKIPNSIDIELKEFNFEGYSVSKNRIEEKGEIIITYEINDIDAFPKERNAPGRSFYAPHVILLSKGIKDKKSGDTIPIIANTQNLYEWYKELVNNANNDNTILKNVVNEIIKNCTTEKQKMEHIFYWIQDNINYIAYENGIAGFQPENCQNVYNNKYGDCKGMANLMTEMLRLCGIDARITWLGTNSIAYDYSTPSLSVDNHAICTVIIDDEYYFLDGTEKYIGVGDYAERIQGKEVLIENGPSYIIKKIPNFSYKRNLNKIDMSFNMENDILTGNINVQYNGESKVQLLNLYHSLYNEHKDIAKNYLIIREDNNIQIDDVKISDIEKRDDIFDISSKVKIENKIHKFGNELYLDWDLYKEFSDFKIDTNRTLDYILNEKIYKENEYVYQTPKGYKIKKVPANLLIESNDFKVKLNFDFSDNQLRINKDIIIPNARILKSNINLWNEAIDKLNEYYKTVIIYEKH